MNGPLSRGTRALRRACPRRASAVSLIVPLVLALGACAGTGGPPIRDAAFEPAPPEPSVSPEYNGGAIYQPTSNRFFFEDIRARRVGDVITVILDERTAASKSASTSAARGTSVGIAAPSVFGRPVSLGGKDVFSVDLAANTDFAGSGDSNQSNQLSGSVAVTVHEVLPNGLLRIRGQKVLTLNQGSEVVRLSGLVRSADIRPGNAVLSTEIADANITYGGNGLVADSNRAGWLTRFFTSASWPF